MHCPRPFEQFYVAENGDVHLCCPEWIAMPAGNLLATPPLDIWRGKVAGHVRKSVLDQSFRHCIACPFLPGPAGCVADQPPGSPCTDRIHTLTMAYDPSCNLQCPSCRTEQRCNPRASRIQDILLESGIFDVVDRLASSGCGDPLASQLFWNLLSRLPPQKYPHLRLILQTNGLLLTQRNWERMGEYAERINEILLSVDAGTPETYLQNRGGDWHTLVCVIGEITARKIPLQLNFVVQANNFREIPTFIVLALQNSAQRVYFSALDNWGSYDEEDYRRRAVHLPGHPDHAELLDVLQNPILKKYWVTHARLPRTL